MLNLIFLILIGTCLALDCTLYDYSKPTVACAQTCPASTTTVANFCLTSSQYMINSQVFACQGYVSSDRSTCCPRDYYIQGNTCLKCMGQIYNNGLNCCPADNYLDFSQAIPNCIPVSTGNCPRLLLTSPFKVCCPSQQSYNIQSKSCQSNSGLNCDQNLQACCPNGQYL